MMGQQNSLVLAHMESNGGITQLEAIKYGVTRLAARIWDLRHKYGYEIIPVQRKAINQFGKKIKFCEYRLVRHL